MRSNMESELETSVRAELEIPVKESLEIFLSEVLDTNHYRLEWHTLLASTGSWLRHILATPQNLAWQSHQTNFGLRTS
jgi:hypothetical protein